MTVTGFRHMGITVSDLDRSLAFYRDYLGLQVVAEYRDLDTEYIRTLVGEPDQNIDIVVLTAPDGMRVELLYYRSHSGAAGSAARAVEPGRPHVAFSVRNLADLYKRRQEAGCMFKSPPLHSPDGVWVAYAHDPDGTILELVQPQETAE
ncbi:MAG TPA: hypothetical protein DC046_09005 [Rhodospirillaceae bacterium]|nr:hypothetical protein [Rhodospirillaceae bacterium]|tara:strand:+ start:51 stop:497 length:447 start_codon:yes stop_codon:yes gene_type:complete